MGTYMLGSLNEFSVFLNLHQMHIEGCLLVRDEIPVLFHMLGFSPSAGLCFTKCHM